jgi:hypothetical protein
MKLNWKHLIFVVAFSVGCLPFYYPALFYRRSAPILTPKRSDQQIHYNGSISISNTDFLRHTKETNIAAALGYSLSKYGKWLGFDVQSELVAGSYDVVGIQEFDGWKHYGGLSTSIFSGFRFGNDRLGLAIGPQGGCMLEFGQYSEFRKQAKSRGLIDANGKDYFFHLYGVLNIQFFTKTNTCYFLQAKGGIYEFATVIFGTSFQRNSIWLSVMPPLDCPGVTCRLGYSYEMGSHKVQQ